MYDKDIDPVITNFRIKKPMIIYDYYGTRNKTLDKLMERVP